MDSLPLLAAILTVAGGMGIAYAVFTSARVQSTITLYKEENEAQGKRITTLSFDMQAAKEQLKLILRENEMLKDLATGKSAIEAMSVMLTREESQRHQEHVVMTMALEAVKDELIAWRAGGGRPG